MDRRDHGAEGRILGHTVGRRDRAGIESLWHRSSFLCRNCTGARDRPACERVLYGERIRLSRERKLHQQSKPRMRDRGCGRASYQSGSPMRGVSAPRRRHGQKSSRDSSGTPQPPRRRPRCTWCPPRASRPGHGVDVDPDGDALRQPHPGEDRLTLGRPRWSGTSFASAIPCPMLSTCPEMGGSKPIRRIWARAPMAIRDSLVSSKYAVIQNPSASMIETRVRPPSHNRPAASGGW